MAATYDRHGITFLYPENWHVNEEAPHAHTHCVTLQSPGSGFWMLQAFQTGESPERLASEALRSIKQEYSDIEVERVEEDIAGVTAIGYDLQFYCLDFVVSSSVRSFTLADRVFVLLWQAEDTEFDQISRVFSAISTSLVTGTSRLAADNERGSCHSRDSRSSRA